MVKPRPRAAVTSPPSPGQVVLGLDPGLESTGWGVVVVGTLGRLEHLAHGCLHTSSADTLPVRTDQLAAEVHALLCKWGPAAVAMEAWVPYGGARGSGAGANTMRVLGAIRAVARLWGQLSVAEYTAQAIKGAVGAGRMAEKRDVQAAVARALGIATPRPTHAADALAVALAYCWAPHDGTAVVAATPPTPANRNNLPPAGPYPPTE